MTSRISSNNTPFTKLLRFELKRSIWLYAVTLLFLLFIQPISLLMRVEVYRAHMLTQSDILNNLTTFFLNEFGGSGVYFILVAFVYGMFFYAFVYSRSAVDLYHSLAISRGHLFMAKYLTALVPVLLMEVLNYGLCLLVLASRGLLMGQLISTASYSLLLNTVAFLLALSLMLIAIMLTGKPILGILGALVLTLFTHFTALITKSYMGFCYQTYYNMNSDSPLWLMLLNPLSVLELCGQYNRKHLYTAVILLAEAVALMFIALVLYQKRPSEKTHTALCYQTAKPIIRIPMIIMTSLGGGLYVSFLANNLNSTWFWLSLAIIGTLTHLILEMIYEQDVKKLYRHSLQLIIGLAVGGAIAVFFLYDLGGYDRYLPASVRVESVAVRMTNIEAEVSQYNLDQIGRSPEYIDSDTYFMNNLHMTDISTVLNLAGAGIQNLNPVRSTLARQQAMITDYSYDPEKAYFTVCYHMRSGRDVYRSYSCNVNQIMDMCAKIYESKEYKEVLYQLPQFIDMGTVNSLEARDYAGVLRFDNTNVDINAFLDAYLKDLDCRKLSDLKSYPLIRLSAYDYISYNDYLSGYYIYESDRHTVDYLKSLGIDITDYRFRLQPEEIKSIKITNYDTAETMTVYEGFAKEDIYADTNSNTTIYRADTDMDKIEKLLPLLVPESFRYNNEVLHPGVPSLGIEVTFVRDNLSEETCYCGLPYGTKWEF